MTTMMNVHEAKANFSGLLSDVENNLATITIMRYGHPIARIVPIEHKRDMKPLPGFAGKVKMHGGDWFAVESVVEERKVRDLIPALKSAGATGIIELPLNKVIF